MTIKIYSRDSLKKDTAKVPFPKDFRLLDHIRETRHGRQQVYEFIGTDTFGVEWNRRQRFEVNAGRDEEPILYTPLYEEVRDAGLPKNVPVNRLGPGGVVFEEVFEGGEVKFSHVTTSEFTVPIRHYATGVEYSKDLVVFNQMWEVPIVERQAGVAYNALLNHLHLNPILAATYTGANQTGANTAGSTTVEDYYLTIEDAITNSKTDTTNPRRGPYYLLVNSSKQFLVEKALQITAQEGVSQQATSAIGMISGVIAYDGWTGTRGNLTTTYSGVTASKGYLVSQQYRGQDFLSFMKQDMAEEGMETDLSRFLTQVVWDCYFGVYANPVGAVEEITWP